MVSHSTKANLTKIQGRKATGPRFLREAMDDSPKDPKAAVLPRNNNGLAGG